MDGFPQQVPSYVKYDFLLTLIGIIIISYTIYLNQVARVIMHPAIASLLPLVGLAFFISGFYEMKDNYFREKEIKTLEYALREVELRKKLKEFTSDKNELNR